jgi:hypothetical protein
MNLPWDKYEYSDPFLVTVGYCRNRYFMWRRNVRTGQYKLKSIGYEDVMDYTARNHEAPNPSELMPVLIPK